MVKVATINLKLYMLKKNSISIIIPSYNSENTIKKCIESVLNQDYNGELEIILSDDGSTDNTTKIASTIHSKIIIIHKPIDCDKHGAAYARNRGLLLARNEYICFLDADDYYLPGHLKKASDFLKTNPSYGYTFCKSKKEIITKDGNIIHNDWTRKYMTRLDKKYHVLFRSFNINTNVIFIRKSVVDRVGFFNTSLSNGEDSDMWIRISEISRGMFLDYFGAVYLVNHSTHQLSKNSLSKKKDCALSIYSQALQRHISSSDNDIMRLFIIVRMLLYIRMQFSSGASSSVYNHLIITLKLFILFPITSIKFICNARR